MENTAFIDLILIKKIFSLLSPIIYYFLFILLHLYYCIFFFMTSIYHRKHALFIRLSKISPVVRQ